MIASLALILAQTSAVNVSYPLTVFQSLCLSGEARFAEGTVNIVTWDETPYGFRKAFSEAKLTFSEPASAERLGLAGSLPGLRADTIVLSNDGNWAAIVEPKGPAGDQRCAVAARVIDRVGLRKYGVVPLEWYFSKTAKLDEVVEEWAQPSAYPGAIVRIGSFAKKGAVIQAYMMTDEAAEADRRVHEAIRIRAAGDPSGPAENDNKANLSAAVAGVQFKGDSPK